MFTYKTWCTSCGIVWLPNNAMSVAGTGILFESTGKMGIKGMEAKSVQVYSL